MFSTELHGNSQAGQQFNDSSILKDINNEVLTKIVLCHRESIDSLTVRLSITIGTGAG